MNPPAFNLFISPSKWIARYLIALHAFDSVVVVLPVVTSLCIWLVILRYCCSLRLQSLALLLC